MKGFAGLCGRIEAVLSVDGDPPPAKDLLGLKQSTVDRIIDFLQDDNAALRTCCLIGRSWMPRSRQHLFRRLSLFEEDCTGLLMLGSRATAFLKPYRARVISLTLTGGKRGEKYRYACGMALDVPMLEGLLKSFTNLRHLALVSCHLWPGVEGVLLRESRFAYHPLHTLTLVPSHPYARADVLNLLYFFRAVPIAKLELLDDNREYRAPTPPAVPAPPEHRAISLARACLRDMRVHTLFVNDRARPWGEDLVHRLCAAGTGVSTGVALEHWGFSHAAAGGAGRWGATLRAFTRLTLSVGPPGYYKAGVPGMEKCDEHWYEALAGCTALRELALVVRAHALGLKYVAKGLHFALSEAPAHLTRLVLQLDFGPSPKHGSVPTAVSVVRLYELLEEVALQRLLMRFAALKTVEVVIASDREGDTAAWATYELHQQICDVVRQQLPGIVKMPGMVSCRMIED